MTTLCLRIVSPAAVRRSMCFEKMPVRIGRAPECECHLPYTFVSREHVCIDLLNGELALRDEGSRGGTRSFADHRLLPARKWIPLASIDHEFLVGPLHFRAELVDMGPTDGPAEPSAGECSATAPDHSGTSATVHYESADMNGAALDAEALGGSLHEALERHRQAADALAVILSEISSLPPERARAIIESIAPVDPRQRDVAACLLDWVAHPAALDVVRSQITAMAGRPRRLVAQPHVLGRTWVTVGMALGLLQVQPVAIKAERATA